MDHQNKTTSTLESNNTELKPIKYNQDTINLLDYLEIIANNWKIIITVSSIVAVFSIVISLCLPNIYSATARILPPQQGSDQMNMWTGASSGMSSIASEILGKGSPADIYVGILNSESISDPIIDSFRLMDIYNKKYRIDTYNQLNKNVYIAAGKKDGIISISVEDKDPKRAADIANAYVDELSKLIVKLNITGANQNKNYLEKRLAEAKIELIKTEEFLKTFKTKNKSLNITEQVKGTIIGVANLEAQLAIEEIKLSGMRRIFTDASQEIKNQQSVIHSLKAQITKFENSRPAMTIPGVGTVPNLEQQYLRLMREFKTQEVFVEFLTKQYEMAKLSETKNISDLQVIQTARVPDKKTKPKRSIIVLISTLLSGFITILYSFIRDAALRMQDRDRARLNNILTLLTFNKIKSYPSKKTGMT